MIIADEVSHFPQTRFSTEARRLVATGERLISLGLGEPAFDTPAEIVEATIEALRAGHTRYSHCLGLPALRERIARKLREENGIDASVEDVVVTVGAKQAFLVALQAILRPGDEVVNITPCFQSFIPAIKIAEPQCVLHNVNLDRTTLDFDLERICAAINERTRVLILNSPHNPSGAMLTGEQLDVLVERLQACPQCHVLSDEIYEYLAFSGTPHLSIGAREEVRDRVFTVNSMSKAFAMTGWRLGYMAVPRSMRSTVSSLLQHSNMNVTTFIQKGACRVFDLDRGFLAGYRKQLLTAATHLQTALAPTPLRMCMPRGGFFCFVDVSATGLTADAFASELLLQTRVALNPGILSGPDWDTHVRISFAGDPAEFHRGVDGILTFLSHGIASREPQAQAL